MCNVTFVNKPTSKYWLNLQLKIKDMIQEVSSRDFILMVDFNYKETDWINNCCDNSSVDSR